MVAGGFTAQQQHCLQELEGVKLRSVHNPRCIVGQQYQLEITWCGHQLQWQVSTDSPEPEAAPDFVFHDEFHPLAPQLQCEAQTRLRRVLLAWDSQQFQYLAVAVKLLLELYNFYQKAKVNQLGDNRLQFEISTLADSWDVQYLYLQPQNGDAAKVCLSLAITLDQRRLVAVYPAAASRPTSFRVVFGFRLNTGSGYTPQASLQVPSHLASMLPAFTMPSWSGRSCIIDYIPEAKAALQQQLDQHLDALQLWNELLHQLSLVLGPPLECNPQRPSAMFAFMSNSTQLLLHIEMPNKFPSEQPIITLQSVMHSVKDSMSALKRSPWSPRWAPTEMGARIINHLREEAPYWLQRLAG